jgi:sugar/nucleoside kinase (ribokinase family)
MPRFDVTVAGELNLDLILYGLPHELPPERELLADSMRLTLGASSAIVAHNLSALGARVGFQTRIGDDPLGAIALERMRDGGVDVSTVRRAAKASGLSVILQRADCRTILTYPGTIFDLSLDDLDWSYLGDSRHFHLCSYYLQRGLKPGVAELFRRMKSAGLTTSLDPNDDPDDTWDGIDEVLEYVDVFLPNAREAQKITRTNDVENAIARLAVRVPVVAVKLGAKGAIAQCGSKRMASPAIQVEAIDAVGAGDSFDAGFVSQYIHGANIETCLEYGNLAGAFSTTRPGGTEAFRDRQYREDFFRRHARGQTM